MGRKDIQLRVCASLHGFLLYLKQSAYFCSSGLRRTFKKLMASFWAINTRASCSHVHVFEFIMNEVQSNGGLCKQDCLLLHWLHMPVFDCMGRCLFCMQHMDVNLNFNRDRCLLHVIYRRDGLFPSKIWQSWFLLMFLKKIIIIIMKKKRLLSHIMETSWKFP